jgi:uncharacterized protein
MSRVTTSATPGGHDPAGRVVPDGRDPGGRVVPDGGDPGGRVVSGGRDGGGQVVPDGGDPGGRVVSGGRDGGGRVVPDGRDAGGRVVSGGSAGRPERDRDAAGRARNARPRDGLGRPLPPGAPGVPTTPDDLSLTPAESLVEAQRLLDRGMPFHAHEVLEASWKAAPEAERELWRGLAQLAVGLTHVRRGNDVGAPRLLRRAADRIEDYATRPPHGIAVADLAGWARTLADRVERTGGGKLPVEDSVPRLTS